MKRTTIFADEDVLAALREIAQKEGVSIAELVRKALKRFIADQQKDRKLLSILGIGQSGRTDISERFEELVWKDTLSNQ